MAILYGHTCSRCTLTFSNHENTGKAEVLCPACEMQPSVDANETKTYDRLDTTVAPTGSHKLTTILKDGTYEDETIKSGFTKIHVKGEPVYRTTKSKTYVYKPKPCLKCNNPFTPAGPKQNLCEKCRPLTIVKTRQAKAFVTHKNLKEPSRGQPVKHVDREALKKLADGLLTEPQKSKEVDRIEMPSIDYYPAGLTMLKKQPDMTSTISGYWVPYSETGKTFDGVFYFVARDLISGRVIIDVPARHERFLSDEKKIKTLA